MERRYNMPDNNILQDALKDLGVLDEIEKEEEDDELEDNPDEDEIEEEEELEEELEEDEEVLDGEDDEDEEVLTEKPDLKTKPTKEDKERFAFEKLRKEAKEKDEQLRQKEDQLKQLDEVAAAYGYTDSKAMIDTIQKQAMKKRADEQGIDIKIYEELQNTKKQIEQLKKEKEQEESSRRVTMFIDKINTFSEKQSLSVDEKEELINRLDEDGFTIETLYNIKNYEKLFTGYLSDKILEKTKQKDLQKEEKRKRLKEDRITNPSNQKETIDANKLIDTLIKNARSRY
jgi:hypothetical protein